MKHSYTTCDICKKEIKHRLNTSFPQSVEVIIPDISPLDMDFTKLYHLVKKSVEDREKDFGNEVSVDVRHKTKKYDLCYKCRKKLIKFIEEGQDG